MKSIFAFLFPFPRNSSACLLSLLLFSSASLKAELLYSTSGNTITITGSNPKASGNLIIPATINNLPVRSIGDYAFWWCTGLTSVTIPDGVTSIGNYAFGNYPCGTFAFQECSGLTSVTIGNSVTSIGEGAFWGCSGLTSFSVDIANTTFSSNDGVLFNKAQTSLLSFPNGKAGGYTIPNSVTSIGGGAFNWCTGLTSVTIGASVTSIGEGAFLWSEFVVGPSPFLVTSIIGGGAFWGCSGLTSFSVDIANTTFSSNDGVLFNKAQTSLLNYPAAKTADYTVPKTVTSIGNSAFWGCSGLTTVTLPSSVTSIGDRAFLECSGLTSVTIPDGVTSIGDFAFYNCIGLTSVTLPSSITSIGDFAFEGCTGLTSVTLPSSITSIGDAAFEGCWGLTSVYFMGNAPSVGSDVFYNAPATIYYIAGKTGWGASFADRTTVAFQPLAITVQPLPLTVKAGSPASFTVTATGTAPLFYQWAKDSVNIAKATNQTFSLAAATVPDVGLYQVTVSNAQESVVSQTARLTVNLFELLYSTNGNTISITGSNPKASGNLVIPSTINNLPVTSIDNYAFWGCSGLTSVTLPNSVTSIGGGAFNWCTGLTSVTIGASVTSIGDDAFGGCSGLTSFSVDIANTTFSSKDGVLFNKAQTSLHTFPAGKTGAYTIPNSVTVIGYAAFLGCSGLTSVTIPNSVTNIGNDAFSGCSGLTSVTIPNSVTSMGNGAFSGCSGLTSVTIPNSVTSIGTSAFTGCSGLNTVTIGNSVNSIGDDAFGGCSGLTSFSVDIANTTFSSKDGVLFNKAQTSLHTFPAGKTGAYTIPNSVTVIGYAAFLGCSGLTSVTIPNSVTNIGNDAFSGCSGLTSVTIPNSVTSIGNGAFSGCSGLTSVYFMGNAPSIGWDVFDNTPATIYYIQGKTGWRATFAGRPIIELLFSSDGVKITITGSNPKATGVLIIPKTINGLPVTSIGSSAFFDCRGLTSVKIPNTVTSIGVGAFSECIGLTSITIPNSVTAIGWGAFYDCIGLTSVYFMGNAPSVGSDAFYDTPATIYYIQGKTGWSATFEGRPTVAFQPLAISVQPLPVTVTAGLPASFTVTATVTPTDTAPLSYQWAKDGVTIANAMNQTLSLAAATTADAGLYQVTISKSTGSVVSQTARLTVNIPGLPGDNRLVLELSTDLKNPLWTPVATNYVSSSGSQRFYRLTVNIPSLPADNRLVLELSTDLNNPTWTPVATNYVSGSRPQSFYRLVPQ